MSTLLPDDPLQPGWDPEERLIPGERIVLAVARNLAGRGSEVPPLTALVLVSIIDRLLRASS